MKICEKERRVMVKKYCTKDLKRDRGGWVGHSLQQKISPVLPAGRCRSVLQCFSRDWKEKWARRL